MASYNTSEQQSLCDVIVQLSGSLEKSFSWLNENDLSMTDDLIVGQELKVSTIDNADIANYLKARNVVPATALSIDEETALNENEGIGYWAIESDFVVS